jgi:hypothetical protein
MWERGGGGKGYGEAEILVRESMWAGGKKKDALVS